MGKNSSFQFKQFRIVQEKSAMKVGTDGVLLGAWTDVSGAGEILDIGTGTGLIALMAAQRSGASITTVEIELNAFNEAVFNVSQSPWKDRIRLFHSSFQEFAKSQSRKFDLIITNPPYFENDKQPPDTSRSTAKHAVLLTFEDLLTGTRKILTQTGRVALILPVNQAIRFRKLASHEGLYLSKLTRVKATPEKNPHRWLMEFRFGQVIPLESELIIESNIHHDSTDEYRELTRDFYLAF